MRSVDRSSGALRWRAERLDGVRILSVTGEVDAANSQELFARLREILDGKENILVDLSELDYIDLSGIRALESAHDFACGAGRKLAIVGSSFMVRRMLTLLRLDRTFSLFESRSQALERL